MSLAWIFLRSGAVCLVLTILFLSQRFWYRALWRVTSNWGRIWLRWGVRLLYISGLVLIILAVADNLRQDRGRIVPDRSGIASFAGLWFLSALGAYLCVSKGMKELRGLHHVGVGIVVGAALGVRHGEFLLVRRD